MTPEIVESEDEYGFNDTINDSNIRKMNLSMYNTVPIFMNSANVSDQYSYSNQSESSAESSDMDSSIEDWSPEHWEHIERSKAKIAAKKEQKMQRNMVKC